MESDPPPSKFHAYDQCIKQSALDIGQEAEMHPRRYHRDDLWIRQGVLREFRSRFLGLKGQDHEICLPRFM